MWRAIRKGFFPKLIMYAPPAITVSVLTKPSISYTVLPLYLWSMKCFLFTSSNSMHFLKRQTYMIQKASPDCGPSPFWHPFMILILLLCSTFDTDVKLFNYKIKVCLRPLLLEANHPPTKWMRIDLLQKGTSGVWWPQDRSVSYLVPPVTLQQTDILVEKVDWKGSEKQ